MRMVLSAVRSLGMFTSGLLTVLHLFLLLSDIGRAPGSSEVLVV